MQDDWASDAANERGQKGEKRWAEKKKKERVNVEKNKSVWGGVMKWDVEKQGSVNNTDGKVGRKERRRQTKGS